MEQAYQEAKNEIQRIQQHNEFLQGRLTELSQLEKQTDFYRKQKSQSTNQSQGELSEMLINLSIFIDDLRKCDKYEDYLGACSEKFAQTIQQLDLNITNDQIYEQNMNEFLITLLKEFESFLDQLVQYRVDLEDQTTERIRT